MNFENFEKYNLNRLSANERQIIEDEFSKNPELFEGLQDFVAFLAVLDRLGLHNIRQKLLQTEAQLEQEDFFLSEQNLDTLFLGKKNEKKNIEGKIRKDPNYEALAKQHEEIVELVEIHGVHHLKKQLNETVQSLEKEGFFRNIEKNFGQSRPSIRRTINWNRILIPIAAAILLVLGFFFFVPKFLQTPTIEYAWAPSHLEQDLTDSRVSGFANPQKARLDSRVIGLDLVKNQNYQEAIEQWKRHLDTWPDDLLAKFYLAQSLREERQYDDAIKIFESLNITKQIYPDDVLFHLAICYLHIENGCAMADNLLRELLQQYPDSNLKDQAIFYRLQSEKCL